MNIEKYIIYNVKLFTNKTYFQLFKTILLNLINNFSIYEKHCTLFGRINNINSNNNILTKKNYENTSYWFIIMKIILDKVKIKEKNNFPENNSKINTLVFSYLIKLCKMKIQKLLKLSLREKASSNNLILLYLDLCEKAIYPENYKDNNIKKSKYNNISLDTTRKLNFSQSTRLNSASKKKTKIFKQNKIKNLNFLSLNDDINNNNNNNHNNNSKEDDDDIEGNNVKQKYGIGRIKLLYRNSLSRLFIGNTDEKSVKEKYLMNITVKKDTKIKLNGYNMSKAECYAKGLNNEIIKEKGKHKGIIIDQNLEKVINRFYKEQKYLEEYKKGLKNNNNSIIKKIKRNVKFNKTLQIYDSNSIKGLHSSASCFDFRTITNRSNKNIKNNSKNIKVNLKSCSLSTPKTLINNYNKKQIKVFLKSSFSSKDYTNNTNISKRKISKYLLNKLKENKNTFTYHRKTEFQNYMSKKDFFYNDEYII